MVQRAKQRRFDISARKPERERQGDPSERIYRVVSSIPRGKVATYGQVALLADIPAGHRVAARAMRCCPETLAWYRVVAKKDARRAKIALGDAEHARLQERRLRAEGVHFDAAGCIALCQFGWLPMEAQAAPKRNVKARPPSQRAPSPERGSLRSQMRAKGAAAAAERRRNR